MDFLETPKKIHIFAPDNVKKLIIMKKLFVALVAIAALCACGSGEKKYLDYRGLSMGMPFKTF